ncbi:MAG: DNA polymerase III subunit beta [Microthrixaceae bacterium]|nr:DNA polymerase III subunit beta [Microthrixaceae bacterium]
MKFRCERDVFVEALGAVGRAVGTRSSSPVLSGVHMQLQAGNLVLTATDLDLTISAALEVNGDLDGRAVIPAKLVTEIVRSLEPGAVSMETNGDQAHISAGRSQFSVNVYPADEFPQLPVPGGEPVTIDASALSEGLRQVVPAASSDDSRPILTGVLLAAESEGLRLVATDSYRLAVRDLPGTSVLGEGQHVLIPSRALNELNRVLAGSEEVTLALGEHDARFSVGSVTLTTRLLEGEFPNYRGLIPSTQPNRLLVSRAALLDAVRRVRLLAREATPVRLTLSSDSLELLALTQDIGQASESVDAKYEGSELTVAFNPEYLLDGLEVTPGDEVSLETVDALKPALLRSTESADFLYLLMPVRVS